MIVDWYSYFPTALNASTIDARAQLPSDIREQLIGSPKVFRELISVESSNVSVVEALDSRFNINRSTKFVKTRSIEATANDLGAFSHFFVGVQILDHGKDVFFDLSHPECEKCPWGVAATTPVRVREGILPALDIGEIRRSLQMGVELVLSCRVKAILDAMGATGLRYEPLGGQDGFIANVVGECIQSADDAIVQSCCSLHMTAIAPVLINPKYLVGCDDFQVISEAHVRGQRVRFVSPAWVVSRRVLEVVLREARGLRRITKRVDESFRPL